MNYEMNTPQYRLQSILAFCKQAVEFMQNPNVKAEDALKAAVDMHNAMPELRRLIIYFQNGGRG